MPCRIRPAAFVVVCTNLLVLLGTAVAASAGAALPVVQCLTAGENGPCQVPDSTDALMRAGASDVLLAANFGLLLPATQGGGYQFVCEELYGGKIGDRAQVAPDGRTFVPGQDGLYSSGDGCAWTRSTGALAGQLVWDVAFDPRDGMRVWAVGSSPRVLALSTDGGATLTAKKTFPETLRFTQVMVAPSDPRTMYLAGFGATVPLILSVSTDGGETWTTDENASAGVAERQQLVQLLAVAPDNPQTVYLSVSHPDGDQIWKSTERGHHLVKILTLDDAGLGRGFAFGANASTLYAGARDPLEPPCKPPASLYISRDAGQTWERRPSPATGPRYRCLRYRDGKLYACGGDQSSGDGFLLGVSSDEGKTWSPVITLGNLQGVRSCVANSCVNTTNWLCGSYGICGAPRPAADAGVVAAQACGGDDAAAPAAPAAPPKSHGCSFAPGDPDDHRAGHRAGGRSRWLALELLALGLTVSHFGLRRPRLRPGGSEGA